MAKVTIEGSITPSTFLARGARVTVERTALIDKFIRKGYVNVIAAAAAPAKPVVDEVREIVDAQREVTDSERALSGAPARNASRDQWADFLRGKKIPFWEDDTRNELIAHWDRRDEYLTDPEPEAEDDGGTED